MMRIPPASLASFLAFQRHHPYVLSDGRRFCSLEVAANSLRWMPQATVTHEPTGRVYFWADLVQMPPAVRRAVV